MLFARTKCSSLRVGQVLKDPRQLERVDVGLVRRGIELIGGELDVADADLIHDIRPEGLRMGNLPVRRFLVKEGVPKAVRRNRTGARVDEVPKRHTAEDRSELTEHLVEAVGLLVRVNRKRLGIAEIALRKVDIRGREKLRAGQITEARKL